MPEFRQPSDITVDTLGDRWTVSTLADARHVHGMAMSARLWRIEPDATGPDQRWSETRERFLYIVSGSGALELETGGTPVGPEDVVWIEPGDRFRLSAGKTEPLVVLDAVSA